MCQVWCRGMARHLCLIGGGGQSTMGICALFYIYRDLPLDVPSLV